MWHSSLRESLPALQPANCFHAGVQSNTLVCLGRDPTCSPANAFLSFNIQGELSVHKSTRLQACWLKQSATTGETFTPWALGPPPQSCQVCGRGKRGDNTTARQVIGGEACSVCSQNIWEACCDAGPWKKPRVNGGAGPCTPPSD